MLNIKNIYYYILIVLFVSCTNNNVNTDNNKLAAKSAKEFQIVDVIIIKPQTFYKQIITNGKLSSIQKADLKFRVSGTLKGIFVKNGDQVSKGQTIAVLDNESQRIELANAESNLDKTKLELSSLMLGYNGKTDDTASIPYKIYKNLKIKSGYDEALNHLNMAKLNFSYTILKAPFTGIIANLKTKVFNSISTSDIFCKIINNNYFEVECSVLEMEISYLKKNQSVEIIPFLNEKISLIGTITEINPIVDKNGLIKIKALTKNTTKNLFDGANVKVIIDIPINDQLIVPKEAVVLRSNRKVVFTYKNGLAKWNYVNIAYENSSHYAISKGLNKNDTVIVKGNLNLAHDANVKIIKNNN